MEVTSTKICRQTKVISGMYTFIANACDSVRHPVVVDNSATLVASSLIASLVRLLGVFSTRSVLRDSSPATKSSGRLFDVMLEGH